MEILNSDIESEFWKKLSDGLMEFKDKRVLSLLIAVFVAFSISYLSINSIPLGPDEGSISFYIFKLTQGNTTTTPFIKYGIPFPLFLSYELFGLTRQGLRIAQSFFLALSVIPACILSRNLFDERTAAVTCVLIVTSPIFILQNHGLFPFLPFFSLLFFLFFRSYVRGGEIKFLFLSLLIGGIGALFDLVMIYLILAVLISYYTVSFLKGELDYSTKPFLVGIFSFLFGFLPYILLEIEQNFPTLKRISQNIIVTSLGHRNLAIHSNIINSVINLKDMLVSVPQIGISSPMLQINLIFFVVSAIYLLFTRRRKNLEIILSLCVFLLFSTFVPGKQSPLHLFVISPFVIIVISKGLEKIKGRWGLLLLSVILIVNIYTVCLTNFVLANQREKYTPKLVEFNKVVPPCLNDASTVVVPFGRHLHIYAYFRGKKEIKKMPATFNCSAYPCRWEINRTKTSEFLRESLSSEETFFILPVPSKNMQRANPTYCTSRDEGFCRGINNIFRDVVQESGFKTSLECEVNDSNGRPAFKIYSLKERVGKIREF